MATTYYGLGEHPTGFVGFNVAVEVAGELQLRHFSTQTARVQAEECVIFLQRRLLAKLQELEWQRDNLQHRYQRFVSENQANTPLERGVGVHSISAAFARRGRGQWRACFKVERFHSGASSRQPARLFPFTGSFSEVCEEALVFWAEEHGVCSDDTRRVLNNPPDPEQFKRLRRQMNEHEGYDIPVEALSPVFAEQRSQLAMQRSELKVKEMKRPVGVTSSINTDIQAEMAAWFESVTGSVQK